MSQNKLCWACVECQANQLAHIGGCIPDYDFLSSDEDGDHNDNIDVETDVDDVYDVYMIEDYVNEIMSEVDKNFHHSMWNIKMNEIKNFVNQHVNVIVEKELDIELRKNIIDRIYAHLDFGHDSTDAERREIKT
tara:strand:+ start:108 stop:509 length:402 start_codon:yes stop_codon:yes gene_type:complete